MVSSVLLGLAVGSEDVIWAARAHLVIVTVQTSLPWQRGCVGGMMLWLVQQRLVQVTFFLQMRRFGLRRNNEKWNFRRQGSTGGLVEVALLILSGLGKHV